MKHRILGIPKGNLLGKVDSYVDNEEFYIFYRAKFILDEKKGIIIGLIADRFFEIDLNKEKITPMLYGMWDKMEKMNLKNMGLMEIQVYKEIYCIFIMTKNYNLVF